MWGGLIFESAKHWKCSFDTSGNQSCSYFEAVFILRWPESVWGGQKVSEVARKWSSTVHLCIAYVITSEHAGLEHLKERLNIILKGFFFNVQCQYL